MKETPTKLGKLAWGLDHRRASPATDAERQTALKRWDATAQAARRRRRAPLMRCG